MTLQRGNDYIKFYVAIADKAFVRFVNHPSMAEVKPRAVFLHVCVPGQEDNAPDYTGE